MTCTAVHTGSLKPIAAKRNWQGAQRHSLIKIWQSFKRLGHLEGVKGSLTLNRHLQSQPQRLSHIHASSKLLPRQICT